MPKRKNSRSREEDIDHYKNKIRKLERKIREREISGSNDASDPEEIIEYHDEDMEAATPALRPDDWLLQWPEDDVSDHAIKTPEPQPEPSGEPAVNNPAIDLDTEILAILGDEPSNIDKRGPEIRIELASRLLHIAKEGLNKETRKELISKYPLPANCVEIDAPKMNLEIKAAIPEGAIKRDKGIETKQKQMTSAIACLSEIINSQLNSKTKNNEILQKLMDISKILCDLQHADSMTRKNFILFTVKNDMKEHLKNTKIDTFLFGENLHETLRSAKAVNKSGVELKAETNNRPANTSYKGANQRPLNRKAPPQARRPPTGTAPPALRSREPAATRALYPPSRFQQHQPPRAHSSKTSSQTQQGTYRRRY